MKGADVMAAAEAVIAATYQRFPVVLVKGDGCRVWDSDGRSYLDFVAGIAVCNLGHAHPEVAAALSRQAKTLLHVSNLYYSVPQTQLAQWLVDNSFADRVFFCNSGAEANEAAIKLARKYFHEKGETGRFEIIAMEQSFHGRTMAALSATGQEKIRKGFDPVLTGFDFVPFDDLTALKNKIGPATAAVMLEPLQGEGGVRCPSEGYLKAVSRLCRESGVLLILDEVQTGIGRTGRLFAYEHFGIQPDIMTLAKALGNGLPIGAMLSVEGVAQAFGPGSHATTFGGTPIVTAAALEVVRTIDQQQVVAHAAQVGSYFQKRLEQLKARHAGIEAVLGLGLLLGIKLNQKGDKVVRACMQRGFLINCIQETVLRFVPPLIVKTTEIDALVDCLDDVLRETETS
jgi:acetylornithine/N-succinyldiaminopimelate aminotransferase